MPLYEFRCTSCGTFEEWRQMVDSSKAATCPSCSQVAQRMFSPIGLISLSGSLRLKREDPEPRLIKRDREPEIPRLRNHTAGRPWMLNH